MPSPVSRRGVGGGPGNSGAFVPITSYFQNVPADFAAAVAANWSTTQNGTVVCGPTPMNNTCGAESFIDCDASIYFKGAAGGQTVSFGFQLLNQDGIVKQSSTLQRFLTASSYSNVPNSYAGCHWRFRITSADFADVANAEEVFSVQLVALYIGAQISNVEIVNGGMFVNLLKYESTNYIVLP